MAFTLSSSTALAFFGLFMAVVELYIPNLSRGLEQFLAGLQEKLVASGSWLKKIPGAMHSWGNGITCRAVLFKVLDCDPFGRFAS